MENKWNASVLGVFLTPQEVVKWLSNPTGKGSEFLVSSWRLVWEKVWLSCLVSAQRPVVVLEPVLSGIFRWIAGLKWGLHQY